MGRDAEIWKVRQGGVQRDGRSDREGCREMGGQMGRDAERWEVRQGGMQRDGRSDGEGCRDMEGQTGRGVERWEVRQCHCVNNVCIKNCLGVFP